jgi:hypothetical protein
MSLGSYIGCFRRPNPRITIFSSNFRTDGEWPFPNDIDLFATGIDNDPELMFPDATSLASTAGVIAGKLDLDHYYIAMMSPFNPLSSSPSNNRIFGYLNAIGIPSSLDSSQDCFADENGVNIGTTTGNINDISYSIYEVGSFQNPFTIVDTTCYEFSLSDFNVESGAITLTNNPLEGIFRTRNGYVETDFVNISGYISIKNLFNDVRDYMRSNNITDFYIGIAYKSYKGNVYPTIVNAAGPNPPSTQSNADCSELSGIEMGEFIFKDDRSGVPYSSATMAIHHIRLGSGPSPGPIPSPTPTDPSSTQTGNTGTPDSTSSDTTQTDPSSTQTGNTGTPDSTSSDTTQNEVTNFIEEYWWILLIIGIIILIIIAVLVATL